jgi:hypothetical protein
MKFVKTLKTMLVALLEGIKASREYRATRKHGL